MMEAVRDGVADAMWRMTGDENNPPPKGRLPGLAEYLSAEGWLSRDLPPSPLPSRGDGPIEYDQTPVHVRGEPLAPVWWRGRQWAVTEFGLERLDGTYAVEAARLAEGWTSPGAACWFTCPARAGWTPTTW